ncbi:DUF3145 domain-containing protein [Tessaracoccus sp.]
MTARMAAVDQPQARGMLYIHSAPAALCPHLEWAAGSILGNTLEIEWTDQPAEPRTRRTEVAWSGEAGKGAALASKLAAFERVRFEVTEDGRTGSDGQRFSYTPSLGAFAAVTGVHGDILLTEDRIKHAMANDAMGGVPLHTSLQALLGTPWDDELDAFRYAGEDAPIRWLHHVV